MATPTDENSFLGQVLSWVAGGIAAIGIMACWTVLAITGHTPMEPLITMYQMILGGLGVGGAMAWKAK